MEYELHKHTTWSDFFAPRSQHLTHYLHLEHAQ